MNKLFILIPLCAALGWQIPKWCKCAFNTKKSQILLLLSLNAFSIICMNIKFLRDIDESFGVTLLHNVWMLWAFDVGYIHNMLTN
jgi:hypothetical protein